MKKSDIYTTIKSSLSFEEMKGSESFSPCSLTDPGVGEAFILVWTDVQDSRNYIHLVRWSHLFKSCYPHSKGNQVQTKLKFLICINCMKVNVRNTTLNEPVIIKAFCRVLLDYHLKLHSWCYKAMGHKQNDICGWVEKEFPHQLAGLQSGISL